MFIRSTTGVDIPPVSVPKYDIMRESWKILSELFKE